MTTEAQETFVREWNHLWPTGSNVWVIYDDGSASQGITTSLARESGTGQACDPIVTVRVPGVSHVWHSLTRIIAIARPAPAGAKEEV